MPLLFPSPNKNSGAMPSTSSPQDSENTCLSYLDSSLPASPAPRTGYQGRVYPNGEFSMGAVPRKKKRSAEAKYDALIGAGLDWRSPIGWSVQDGRIQKDIGFNYHFDWEGYRAMVAPAIGDPASIPLGSSDVAISHGLGSVPGQKLESSPRAARGSKGMTTRGRRQIRSGCYLLRQKYQGRLGFLTLTLPSFPYREDLLSFLILEWAELLRHLLIKFKRLAEKNGFPSLYVGCVEIQGERFDKFGHPCPHAHIVYVCRRKSIGNDFYVSANDFRRIWRETIENRLKSLSSDCPIDFEDGASVDCVVLRKDPARYISKYLSKGRNPVSAVKDAGLGSFLPSGWVICCSVIKSLIANLTVDLSFDWKIAILEQIPLVDRGICVYLYKVEGDGFAPGYSGQFSRGTPLSLNPL